VLVLSFKADNALDKDRLTKLVTVMSVLVKVAIFVEIELQLASTAGFLISKMLLASSCW